MGLQGGWFFTIGGWFTGDPPVARWRLNEVRWVRDVAVSGRMTWHRRTGMVRAHVTVTGSGAEPGRLTMRWDNGRQRPRAVVTGRLGGKPVDFRFPAP